MARKVFCSMGMSLDGYIADLDGDINWGEPTDEVMRFSIEELRGVDVHLLGRRLYEIMLYWQDPEVEKTFTSLDREWADLWNPLPKVVFTHTLTELDPSARFPDGSLADEIARLKAEPGDGAIAIGGADLAAQAAALDLIDEYRIRVSPIILGNGVPLLPRDAHRRDLELLEARSFDSGVVFLHYRVKR